MVLKIQTYVGFKMNKIRIIALAMAVAMLAMCMVACGGGEKVSVNCNISVQVNGEEVFGPYNLTVQGPAENPPTVLQAAREAFTVCEVPFEVDENGLSLTSITIYGNEYAKTTDETNIYSWYYVADGVEPESGRAGTNAAVEGQTYTFIYNVTPIDPQEFSDDEGGR
jgi:hypothetical protein